MSVRDSGLGRALLRRALLRRAFLGRALFRRRLCLSRLVWGAPQGSLFRVLSAGVVPREGLSNKRLLRKSIPREASRGSVSGCTDHSIASSKEMTDSFDEPPHAFDERRSSSVTSPGPSSRGDRAPVCRGEAKADGGHRTGCRDTISEQRHMKKRLHMTVPTSSPKCRWRNKGVKS